MKRPDYSLGPGKVYIDGKEIHGMRVTAFFLDELDKPANVRYPSRPLGTFVGAYYGLLLVLLLVLATCSQCS